MVHEGGVRSILYTDVRCVFGRSLQQQTKRKERVLDGKLKKEIGKEVRKRVETLFEE